MDDLTVALVAGLLGGGVSGALIAGFISLRQQGRAFDHERRSRFVDLKRQRYADLLRRTDDWMRTLARQHDVAQAMMRADASDSDMPSLGPTTEIEQLAEEIDLLAPEAVAGPATLLMGAVVGMGMYAYDADRDLRHMIEPLVPINEALAHYTAARNRFIAAAKADLGTN